MYGRRWQRQIQGTSHLDFQVLGDTYATAKAACSVRWFDPRYSLNLIFIRILDEKNTTHLYDKRLRYSLMGMRTKEL